MITLYGIYASIFAEKMWMLCKSYSHFFSKNTYELDIVLTRTVNVLTTNKLVKLKILGPDGRVVSTPDFRSQGPSLKSHWRWKSVHDCMALHCTELSIIIIRYHLDIRNVKHQTIICHVSAGHNMRKCTLWHVLWRFRQSSCPCSHFSFLSAWRGLGSLAIHKKHSKRPWLLGYPQKAPEEALAH